MRYLISILLTITLLFTTNAANPSFMNKGPEEGLWEALEYYEIHHKEIVYAQAILETGHFKSNLAKKGNLFGLKGKNGYRTFSHWSESVKMYKEVIQNRYREGEDYYKFLNRIHYAGSRNYTNVLKRIVNGTNNRSRQSSKRNK